MEDLAEKPLSMSIVGSVHPIPECTRPGTKPKPKLSGLGDVASTAPGRTGNVLSTQAELWMDGILFYPRNHGMVIPGSTN